MRTLRFTFSCCWQSTDLSLDRREGCTIVSPSPVAGGREGWWWPGSPYIVVKRRQLEHIQLLSEYNGTLVLLLGWCKPIMPRATTAEQLSVSNYKTIWRKIQVNKEELTEIYSIWVFLLNKCFVVSGLMPWKVWGSPGHICWIHCPVTSPLVWAKYR